MSKITIADAARRIWVGYAGVLRGLGWLLVLLAATVAVSAAIVFPLWYLSTHFSTLYTVIVIALFTAGILYLIARRLYALLQRPATTRKGIVRKAILRVLIVVAYVVSLYVILGLYVVGLLAIAIPLSAIYVVALGYTLYVRRTIRES